MDIPHSFVPTPSNSDFPLANLPYGIFQPSGERARPGVAIGDEILDLDVIHSAGLLSVCNIEKGVLSTGSLNGLMKLGKPTWKSLRARLQELLSAGGSRLRDDAQLRSRAFHRQRDVTMQLPCAIPNYTDFYSSKEHATNVGSMFRPDNPLLPNWLHLPVGYHGRSSSIVPTGTPVRRPRGQTEIPNGPPAFGPSKSLDFELEMGAFIGTENALGTPVSIDNAEDHIFGLVLVNDWSARDVQRWEYVPLGPFLAKNFATTISPWIVPLEALEPFRCEAPAQDPEVLPYLREKRRSTFDLSLTVEIAPKGEAPFVVTRTNFNHLYWTMAQQIAHHTCGGCNLQAGDLLASGTISGPTPESLGSMLELAWRGTRPVTFPSGTIRKFVEDGDTVIFRAEARRGNLRLGFGECIGTILPALA